MLRRQAVVDRDHRHPGARRQFRNDDIVAVEITQDITAAVEIEQAGARAPPLRPVHPDRDLAARGRHALVDHRDAGGARRREDPAQLGVHGALFGDGIAHRVGWKHHRAAPDELGQAGGQGLAHRPFQTGARFSAKARGPSTASSDFSIRS